MSRGAIRWSAAISITAIWTAAMLASAQNAAPRPGDPLPGISPAEFQEFRLGLDDFLEVETAEEGLGPSYNATSCAVCHNVPTIGGAGTIAELRAATRTPEGEFQSLDSSGETLFQLFSVPGHACHAVVPSEATIFARRMPIPLFGAGLVEAIADDAILLREDPEDRNRDGISGRAARIRDIATGEIRIGRFGWKSQHASLLAFSADAYRNEMGITNDLFPTELAVGVTAERMRVCDPMPDPEDIVDPRTRRRGIDNFASFMRLLGPPGRGAGGDTVRAGEEVFGMIGCTACHVPSLETDRHNNPLFDRRPVPLFSDLLLHDVGTGDGIVQAGALASEIRTPALWGLRFRRPLLHDGSASTIDEAISRHRHEAELVRQGFDRLSGPDRAALIAFLKAL